MHMRSTAFLVITLLAGPVFGNESGTRRMDLSAEHFERGGGLGGFAGARAARVDVPMLFDNHLRRLPV